MFDALLRAGGLRPPELDDLRFFGVTGALVPSDDSAVPCTADAIRRGWDEVVAAVRRLRRAGLAAWAALGVHPARIPTRGLEALLAELPHALGRPEAAALGLVGLAAGVARELRRPVVAGTRWRGRERTTRRLLVVLGESELEPERVLVAGADARTVRAIRACGHLAALPLSADGRRGGIDPAVRIVRSLGAEGIVLGSDAGQTGGDLLALPRAADRLGKAGLSDAVVRRVCGENALAFLGVDADAVRARPPRRRT